MIFSDLLRMNLEYYPQKEAIYCEPCALRFTYKDLNRRVNCICNMLLEKGLKNGDRICIISSNCHIHPELLMTAAKGGFSLVEIDHRLSAKEIEYIIKDSEPRVIFVAKGLTDAIFPIVCKLPELDKIELPGEYEEIIASYSDKEPEVVVKDTDIITLMYTSGTTGQPKGVIYTHKNLRAAIVNLAATLEVSADDRTLHTSPFSHIAPIWPFLLHCFHGGSSVIIDNFNPIHILSTIEREKITTWNTIPLLLGRIIDTEGKDEFDCSSLRWVTYGASPIAKPLLEKALSFFGNILNQVYGTTEVYIVTFLHARDHMLKGSEKEVKRLESCGKEVVNTETIVVHKDGQRINSGEIGEVITRGGYVSPGYWKNEEETRQSMKEGWFYTGDLATVDEEGFIYIKGRRKELINTGGENVSPREIEDLLHSHKEIKEAAVVGIPHDQWGEAVTAFVILQDQHALSEEHLLAFCRERLAGYKCPKAAVFLEDFPRTTSGKILKRTLGNQYANKIYNVLRKSGSDQSVKKFAV